jgi:hypothetical protein
MFEPEIYQKLVIISEDYLSTFLHVLLCNTYIVWQCSFDLSRKTKIGEKQEEPLSS